MHAVILSQLLAYLPFTGHEETLQEYQTPLTQDQWLGCPLLKCVGSFAFVTLCVRFCFWNDVRESVTLKKKYFCHFQFLGEYWSLSRQHFRRKSTLFTQCLYQKLTIFDLNAQKCSDIIQSPPPTYLYQSSLHVMEESSSFFPHLVHKPQCRSLQFTQVVIFFSIYFKQPESGWNILSYFTWWKHDLWKDCTFP